MTQHHQVQPWPHTRPSLLCRSRTRTLPLQLPIWPIVRQRPPGRRRLLHWLLLLLFLLLQLLLVGNRQRLHAACQPRRGGRGRPLLLLLMPLLLLLEWLIGLGCWTTDRAARAPGSLGLLRCQHHIVRRGLLELESLHICSRGCLLRNKLVWLLLHLCRLGQLLGCRQGQRANPLG